MNAKSVMALEEITAKRHPKVWKRLQAEIVKGGTLISAGALPTGSKYEVIYTCPRLGLCRTIFALHGAHR